MGRPLPGRATCRRCGSCFRERIRECDAEEYSVVTRLKSVLHYGSLEKAGITDTGANTKCGLRGPGLSVI